MENPNRDTTCRINVVFVDWVKAQGTQAAAAAVLRLPKITVSAYVRGLRSPTHERKVEIRRRTKSAVPVKSWPAKTKKGAPVPQAERGENPGGLAQAPLDGTYHSTGS